MISHLSDRLGDHPAWRRRPDRSRHHVLMAHLGNDEAGDGSEPVEPSERIDAAIDERSWVGPRWLLRMGGGRAEPDQEDQWKAVSQVALSV